MEQIQDIISEFLSSIPHSMVLAHEGHLKAVVKSFEGAAVRTGIKTTTTGAVPVLIQDFLFQMLLDASGQNIACILDGLKEEMAALISQIMTAQSVMPAPNIYLKGQEFIDQSWNLHTHVKSVWLLLDVLERLVSRVTGSSDSATMSNAASMMSNLLNKPFLPICRYKASLMHGCI